MPTSKKAVAKSPWKVAIVGFTSSRRNAPWDDWQEDGVELWGINNLHAMTDIPTERCSRWFDLHPGETIHQDKIHYEWLKQQRDMPIYFVDPPDDVECAQTFPKSQVLEAYGNVRYYTNTISWQLAYAGLLMSERLNEWKRYNAAVAADPKGDHGEAPPQPEIGIYGVDMAQETEYAAQRPSCEYFIGVMTGVGYLVTIAETSDLLQAGGGLYGFDDNGPLRAKKASRITDLEQKIQELQGERNQTANRLGQLDGEIQFTNGCLQECKYWRDRWTMPEIDREANTLESQK